MQNKKTQYYLNKEEEKGQQDVFILNILFEHKLKFKLGSVVSLSISINSILLYYYCIFLNPMPQIARMRLQILKKLMCDFSFPEDWKPF